jgi:hypothetical protein
MAAWHAPGMDRPNGAEFLLSLCWFFGAASVPFPARDVQEACTVRVH